jgi:prepilin-type N-terminal cleavage/methylation domain-containing protein
MRTHSPQKGFVLIEMIATIILIGIIGIFTGFFLYTGVKGYLTAKETTEGSLRAQIALDRISLELGSIETLTDFNSTPPSITYTSRDPLLPGTRTLSYNSDTDVISINNGATVNALLDNVPSFQLGIVEMELNADTSDGNEIAGFEVKLQLDEIQREFIARFYPRKLIPAP